MFEEEENGQHSSIFGPIGPSSFFASNMDSHKVSDQFKVRPDPIMDSSALCCI